MKTADAIWMCLPEGLNELFEMVRFEKTDQSYDIWLDEKKKLSDDDYRKVGAHLAATAAETYHNADIILKIW